MKGKIEIALSPEVQALLSRVIDDVQGVKTPEDAVLWLLTRLAASIAEPDAPGARGKTEFSFDLIRPQPRPEESPVKDRGFGRADIGGIGLP